MSETGYALGKKPEPQIGEEVKERLRHSREVLRKCFGDLFGRTTFDFALEYIEMLESAQPKWISVEDPPKDTSPVLIWYLHSSGLHLCTIGSYLKKLGVWDTDMGFALEQITHWMPLPEAPKEE